MYILNNLYRIIGIQTYYILQNELITVLYKSNDLLLENVTYSLNLNIKSTDYYYHYRHSNYETDHCMIGIKRIAQCTDEYRK